MRRVALKIAYEGAGFNGSQYQVGLPTVVGDMMRDLQTVCRGKEEDWFDIKPSSRTDAGVNALGNVVAINTDFRDNATLLKALNSVSGSIYYLGAADVPVDFNPRYANERIYRYVLPSESLDIPLLRECASLFIGEHDFAMFCKIYENKPTVTTIDSIDIVEKDGIIELTFRAQFFLWNMIRKIVAALTAVASGKNGIDDVKEALNGKTVNFGIADPDALTLLEVKYEGLEFEPADPSSFSDRIECANRHILLRKSFLDSLTL